MEEDWAKYGYDVTEEDPDYVPAPSTERKSTTKYGRMNTPPGASSDGSNVLFVNNLAHSASVQQLFQEFVSFGPIMAIEIVTNEQGKSKGFCFINFVKPADAARAMAKVNGRLVGGNKLVVTFARPPKH